MYFQNGNIKLLQSLFCVALLGSTAAQGLPKLCFLEYNPQGKGCQFWPRCFTDMKTGLMPILTNSVMRGIPGNLKAAEKCDQKYFKTSSVKTHVKDFGVVRFDDNAALNKFAIKNDPQLRVIECYVDPKKENQWLCVS
jgi:hypothetical protein